MYVMYLYRPHNLFLHSSIIQTRNVGTDEDSIKSAIHYATIESTISLIGALFVNAAILIVSAATFYTNGYHNVTTLQQSSSLLSPVLHNKAAPILFGIALLASGQNSTLTGTLSGQIVMEGFTTMKINPTVRRVVTRLLAIVPSIIAIAIGGSQSANNLLILSQVVLTYALPFALVPLVYFTSMKKLMGIYVNNIYTIVLAIIITLLIIVLNLILLIG